MDTISRQHRSWNMSQIRGRDTGPELIVRSLLHRMGFRFRLHVRIPLPQESGRPLFARPDIILKRYRVAIFVHGCFWHQHRGCRNCTMPSQNREFWARKLNGNVARDRQQRRWLRRLGWRVLVVWECETEFQENLSGRLNRFIAGEIAAVTP